MTDPKVSTHKLTQLLKILHPALGDSQVEGQLLAVWWQQHLVFDRLRLLLYCRELLVSVTAEAGLGDGGVGKN